MQARRFSRLSLVLVVLGATLLWGPVAGAVEFPEGELTIATAGGARHDFRIEIAVTPAQRAQGLMYRTELAPDAGMLFVYESEGQIAMWMKNTFVSLDMLFISRRGEILRIAERTVPHSTATIPSGGLVKGVLEVPAGTAARLGIAPGDRVLHPAFGTGP